MNIAQIAEMAGVSSAAVSRYFNNGYVSREKRERIREVVEATGYRPSAQAQTLRTKKTKMVGVLIPKINSSSISSVVAGIISVLDQNGYYPILADTQNNPEKELSYLELFDEKQVDGLLYIATVFTERHQKILKNVSVPMVIIGQHLGGYPCVYHDDYHAFYDITNLVLHRGRRNIGYLSALHTDVAAGAERYRAFCDAVCASDLPSAAEQYVLADFTIESGYAQTEELLHRYPELDAIICATDEMAVGAMQYLNEHHVRVPEQVMVTGQGDNQMTSVTTPTITTIRYAYEESGAAAAGILLERIHTGDSNENKNLELGYTIVEKQSTMI